MVMQTTGKVYIDIGYNGVKESAQVLLEALVVVILNQKL